MSDRKHRRRVESLVFIVRFGRALLIAAAAAVAAHAAARRGRDAEGVLGQVVGKAGLIYARPSSPQAFSLSVLGPQRAGRRRDAAGGARALRKEETALHGARLRVLLEAGADAGSLFVRSIGSDVAKGRDGWVYKVGHWAARPGPRTRAARSGPASG